MAAQGCCNDFTNPCFVPAFPDRDDYHYRWIRPDGYGDYRAYGPNGLFWPFGGSGFFMSAGMAVDVIGAMGWKDCARRFSDSPTDMQVQLGSEEICIFCEKTGSNCSVQS